jgi:acetyl esterase/lipase
MTPISDYMPLAERLRNYRFCHTLAILWILTTSLSSYASHSVILFLLTRAPTLEFNTSIQHFDSTLRFNTSIQRLNFSQGLADPPSRISTSLLSFPLPPFFLLRRSRDPTRELTNSQAYGYFPLAESKGPSAHPFPCTQMLLVGLPVRPART